MDFLYSMTIKPLNFQEMTDISILVVKDTENQVFSSVYSIAEDLDGNIWIGTDQGPLDLLQSGKGVQ